MSKNNIITLRAQDGTSVEFVDQVAASGAMKDVYFSPDKSCVVGFFRKHPDAAAMDRLENITDLYRKSIFEQAGGDYWKNLFCWPTSLVDWNGKIGIVSPTYDPCFFFSGGRYKGKEKEGKWFASARLRNRFLDPSEKGNWLTTLKMCLNIARAVRRLHSAGLAHSDLSYKNVLVDPQSGRACIIDIDGLVVPGKYPPDVVGTPDFIAPEVMATRSLKLGDPKKVLPSIRTDRHALAVLIYMYLLNRHPLRGSKVHDLDSTRDEELSMGSKALFVEHPTDKSNRPKVSQLSKAELPQGDVTKRPYTICGPYLTELFNQAFIKGLHDPDARPSAADWEQALIKTADLLQPCQNKNCAEKWYAFGNTKKPVCPFCETPFHGKLPVLNFYSPSKDGKFQPEGYRLMVYNQQSLYAWHANRFISPNEKVNDADKKPVGDFHFMNGNWILVNRRLKGMRDLTDKRDVKIQDYVKLTDGRQILLTNEPGGRAVAVQLVDA